MKNILKENMHRFNTKNLKEDHPGILLPAAKMTAAGTGVLVAAVKHYSQLFTGTAEERKQARMVVDIQTMIMRDTAPDEILKFMKSIDPTIDDEMGIEIMKILGSQLGVYTDPENKNDASPLN